MPKAAANHNTATDKNNISIKIDLADAARRQPRRRRKPKQQEEAQPEVNAPTMTGQPQAWGIAPFAPRPVMYVPTTQQIRTDVAVNPGPFVFESQRTNIERTLEDMRANFQGELDDLRNHMWANARDSSHYADIDRVVRDAQTSFDRELRSAGVQYSGGPPPSVAMSDQGSTLGGPGGGGGGDDGGGGGGDGPMDISQSVGVSHNNAAMSGVVPYSSHPQPVVGTAGTALSQHHHVGPGMAASESMRTSVSEVSHGVPSAAMSQGDVPTAASSNLPLWPSYIPHPTLSTSSLGSTASSTGSTQPPPSPPIDTVFGDDPSTNSRPNESRVGPYQPPASLQVY